MQAEVEVETEVETEGEQGVGDEAAAVVAQARRGERREARRPAPAPELRPGELAKLTKEQKEKKAELDRLSPNLWPLYQKFRSYQRDERSVMIHGRYEQGRILLLAEKHHRNGLMAVGGAAGMSITMIREVQLVARRVSEEEVMTFISAADSDPTSGMGWVHLAELAVIESPEDRMGYIRKTAKLGLSVDDLRQMIADDGVKVYTDGVRAGAGRPFALPSSPVALFDRFRRQAEQLQRFMVQAAGPNMEALVRETPVEKIGPDGLAKMQCGRDAIQKLRDELDAKLGEIDSLLADVVPGIEAYAAAVPAAAIGDVAGDGPVPMPPPAFLPADRPPSPAFASAS